MRVRKAACRHLLPLPSLLPSLHASIPSSSAATPHLVVETNEPFYAIHWNFNSGSPAAISQIGQRLNLPLKEYKDDQNNLILFLEFQFYVMPSGIQLETTGLCKKAGASLGEKFWPTAASPGQSCQAGA